MIPPSTPIDETRAALPEKVRAALTIPPHVRTAHDLAHAIARGEVQATAAVLRAVRAAVGEA